MPIQTCFESNQELALFQRFNPDLSSRSVSFEQWLDQIYPVPKETNRLEIARLFKKTHLSAEQWLPTIELLRRALVLNSEQVTYCFSELPSTRKNRSLRDCFLFYLNSPLAQDLMGQVWSLVEKLKSPQKDEICLSPVEFVSSVPSAYLFQELSEAARSHCSKVSLGTFFDLCGYSIASKPELTLGTKYSSLEALCGHIASSAKAHSEDTILISFFGSAHSHAFLRSRLASFGLLPQSLLPSKNAMGSYWSQILNHIRQSHSLKADEKISLNSALLANPPFENELYEAYTDRLSTQGILSSEAIAFITNSNLDGASTVQPTPARVLIVPFCALPHFENVTEFTFVDESFLEPTRSETLFSESELEVLFFAGFQMPRWSQTLKGRLTVLEQKSRTLADRVYASFSPELLEGFEIKPPKKNVPTFFSSENSQRASLPISTLSATQLETYAECPSKYLFRRFKLHQVPMPMSEFALHLGQTVHLTLEILFSSKDNPALSSNLLRATFKESLSKVLPQIRNESNLSLFFLKAFERMIPRILEMEASLNQSFGNRTTLAVEKEFKTEVDGVSVVGKIDRVDLLSNNSLLVLDYKTGTVDFTPDHLTKGFNFQALLYWLGAEEALGIPPAAMLFYDLKKGELKRGLAQEELISTDAKKSLTRGHAMPAEKLESLIASGKAAMNNYANKIRSGDFIPTPSAETCRFCEAAGFCREGDGYV